MVSRFFVRWTAPAVALLLWAGVAAASTGSITLVWQPMGTGDYGTVISAVTYLSDYNPSPEDPIWFTVRANQVPRDQRSENSNVAAYYSLTIKIQPRMALFTDRVDTLHVTLGVPADEDTSKKHWWAEADEVVPATAQCILFNARSLWPYVHFVDLKIVGSRRWKDLSRVHSLERVRVPERPLQLSGGKLQE